MNEDFDVKLVENAKYYTPDCGVQAYLMDRRLPENL